MKNHLQEIIAENISKKYGFEKEKILCFFDKNPYVNCIFPYAVMTAIQKKPWGIIFERYSHRV